jgi:serine phosphatase RsbU (regulator of sigma subunit)
VEEPGGIRLSGTRAAVIAVVSVVVLITLYPLSQVDYLLFHSLVETFAALVAVGIFVIAWNTRAINETEYLGVLGAGMFFVGLTTLVHMLAYKGMGVFHNTTANLPTQLWIVSRLFAGSAFVAAGVSLRRRVRARPAFVAFAVVWFVAMATLSIWPVFPEMYAPGVGLTPLKIALEYVIMALFAVSAWLLWRNRKSFDTSIVRMLLVAIALMIAGEMAFTLYVDVYGVLNLLGHYLVLASAVLVYVALIDSALTRPYALLFRELHRREQEEHRIADVLQSSLLSAPERVRSIELGSAHRSATTGALVGGDFYDLWSPSRGKVAFVLGDVCGKGIEAAASTAMVRTTIRSFSYVDPSPGEVLHRANEAVARQLPEDKFVTVVYGLIDAATGEATVASAGHPDPIVRRGHGETSLLDLPRNPPLGVVPGQGFDASEVTLAAGELLVLYTDGLVDAGWRNGAFGTERALDVVARVASENAPSAARALLEAAVAYASEALSDDVAVVALRFSPDGGAQPMPYVP